MKIRPNNTEKLQAILDVVQADSKVRTITLKDIDAAIKRIEENLAHRLAKKHWVGLRYNVDPCAQKFPGSYFGVPESTRFTVERLASGWFITSIERASCGTAVTTLASPLQDHHITGLAAAFSKSF